MMSPDAFDEIAGSLRLALLALSESSPIAAESARVSLDALIKHVSALESVGAQLSATQCRDPIADPHGGMRCGEIDKRDVRIAELEAALMPFAVLASTFTVEHAAKANELLTLSHRKKFCYMTPDSFLKAQLIYGERKDG